MENTDKGFELLSTFFEDDDQISYQTPHELIPQFNYDSCVAACVRMILADFDIYVPESYLATALDTTGGAFLSKVPEVLEDFGLPHNYEWQNDLSLSSLSDALKQGSAVISVKRRGEIFGHALVVDAIFENEVRLRDPLPRNEGKSYAVAIEKFSEVFFRKNETGFGVIRC
jgi:hypothetical protein